MKKPLSILLLVVMLLSLVSCSVPGADATGELITENATTAPATEGTKAPSGKEKQDTASPKPTKKPEIKPDDPLVMKLWLLYVGQGFESEVASGGMVWKGLDEVNSKTTVTLQTEIGSPDLVLKPPTGAESVKKGSMEYFVFESLKVGDYRREIYWAKDGASYKLKAETFLEVKKKTIDIASLETAESLIKNPFAGVSGFKYVDGRCNVVFQRLDSNGSAKINITLYPLADVDSIKIYLDRDKDFIKKTEGRLEYFINSNGGVIWTTDIGPFVMFVSKTASQEFANSSFIENINKQLGAKPLPFPD